MAFLALIAPGRACAQRNETYWFGVGLGAGALGSQDHADAPFGKFAAEMSGFWQKGTRAIGVRASSTDGALESDGWDVAALYGVATPPARWHALAATGVGFASHSIDNAKGDDPARRNHVCLPLEVELTYRPFYWVGIGGFGYASLASGESAGGVGAFLQLGKLR
jgi:hypothetical protein